MLKTIDEKTWAPKVVDDTTLELAGIYKELLGQAGPIAKEVIAGMNFAKRGLVNAALGIYGGLDGILAKQVDPITAEVEKNVQSYKTRLKKEQLIRATLGLISSDFSIYPPGLFSIRVGNEGLSKIFRVVRSFHLTGIKAKSSYSAAPFILIECKQRVSRGLNLNMTQERN